MERRRQGTRPTTNQEEKETATTAMQASVKCATATARREKRVEGWTSKKKRVVLVKGGTSESQKTTSKNAKNSQWPDGIPPDMGGHKMGSGKLSPKSRSKGPGMGPKHMFQYKETETDTKVIVHEMVEQLAEGLAQAVVESANRAVQEKGAFALAVSGGSAGTLLAALESKDADFSKWHVFFVDERCVPLDHPDSNYKALKDAVFSKLTIPDGQIYTIADGQSAAEVAAQYEGVLKSIGNQILPISPEQWPIFDLVILGIGPDGHVGSLFPNRKETAAEEGWVLPVEKSPKPPTARITLSMPVINAAKKVIIAAAGATKSEICQRALEVVSLPGAIPAQLVGSPTTEVCWLLDEEAAKDLSTHKWEEKKAFPRSSF